LQFAAENSKADMLVEADASIVGRLTTKPVSPP